MALQKNARYKIQMLVKIKMWRRGNLLQMRWSCSGTPPFHHRAWANESSVI